MDLNHDYVEHEAFLVAGARERLQMCKCAVLANGDLGYTDPPIPDMRDAIGEYTDAPTAREVEQMVRSVLELSQLVRPSEILSIEAVPYPEGFSVTLNLSFGTEVLDVPTAIL